MNIINIIKGIELLAVELLMWIIYVPKTLYKIIKDPNWAPGYIKEELEKKDKFTAFLSPVLLFLAISVLLFALYDSGLIIAPDYDEKKGSFPEKLQGPIGLLFLALPLFFALFVELFRKGVLKRSNLLRSLYVQCYYFSPLMLSFFAYMLADQFDWENTSGELTYLSLLTSFILYLTLLWFIIIQVRYISRELKYGILKSLRIHLLCYIFIAFGLLGYYVLLVPDVVNETGTGLAEKVILRLPDTGEYQVDIWAVNGDSLIENTPVDSLLDYTLSSHIGATDQFIPSEKLTLIHNQVVYGQTKEKLLFTFTGSEGDLVVIEGSPSLLNADGFLSFDAYINNPNKSLMFDYGTGPEPRSSQVWTIRPKENAPGFVLEIVLPKSGTYTLVINDLKNDGTDFTLGFYKNDIYGNTGESRTGKLVQGTAYCGRPLFGDFYFSRWSFTGSKNEDVTLILKPRKELKLLDLAFNVINEQKESVVPIDRTAVAYTIHAVYVLLFGYLIVMGYRALLSKTNVAEKMEEEKGKKPGRTVSIIGLILFILMLIFLIG